MVRERGRKSGAGCGHELSGYPTRQQTKQQARERPPMRAVKQAPPRVGVFIAAHNQKTETQKL
jgi:hypothetical protein